MNGSYPQKPLNPECTEALVNGEASSPLIDRSASVTLLGNMHGGYNVATLVELLDGAELAEQATEELKSTLLVFKAATG